MLASNDTWTDGEVSGASSGSQSGAVVCGTACTLVNMYIHDNPKAFAGIYVRSSSETAVSMTIIGGRVTGNGSLGIGGGGVPHLAVSGVEIDHNGASANCGNEGGGFKGVNDGARITDNYVHNNNCKGIWFDGDAANNEIDHNRVDNNGGEGIFYEISHDASIHDNEISGNGAGCNWLWGAGIGIASSYNVQVYGNTLNGNCNGIGETQQNRGTDSSGHPRVLQNVDVHDNSTSGSGKTGAVEDNGADLSTRNLTWENNTFSNGMTFCGLSC